MLVHAVVRFGDQMDLPEPSPQEFEQLAQNLSQKLATELRGVKEALTPERYAADFERLATELALKNRESRQREAEE